GTAATQRRGDRRGEGVRGHGKVPTKNRLALMVIGTTHQAPRRERELVGVLPLSAPAIVFLNCRESVSLCCRPSIKLFHFVLGTARRGRFESDTVFLAEAFCILDNSPF